jgi:phosphoadenosine phosphosulfate reductase
MEQMILDLDGLEDMKEQNRIEQERAMQRSRPLSEKIEESKRILRLAADMSREYYGEPLILNYSGGKDSDVMLHIAESCLASDKFEVQNSHTSVDYPPTVKHIREVFTRLNSKGIKTTINYPKDENGNHITMWNLIVKKQMPPHRRLRYCCEVLKEQSTPNRLCALGVREDESKNREGRDIFALETAKYR